MVVKNMIKLIFNGYYRSGTTMMFKIMKKSNPEMSCFLEPLHPNLLSEITKNTATSLHKFYPWSDYNKKDFKSISKNYKLIHGKLKKTGDDIIPTNFQEVKPLFDLFHNFKKNVILQPNRCHFILGDVANNYNCKFVHIIRNPINVWLSQTLTPPVKNRNLLRKIYRFATKFMGKYGKNYFLMNYLPKNKRVGKFFFGDSDYKLIAKKFNRPINEKDQLSKMLTIWTYFNYYAFTQVNNTNGMIVFYEDIVLNPKKWFEKISNFSGVKLDKKYSKTILPKIDCDENLRQNFVKKLEKLELIDMVKKFYPPEKWFGNLKNEIKNNK